MSLWNCMCYFTSIDAHAQIDDLCVICACAISPTFQAWRGESKRDREREDGGDREYVSASRAAGATGRPDQLLQRRHEQQW